MTIERFGETAEGETVHRLALRAGGLTANVLNWGAVAQDLRLAGHPHPLVLGFPDFLPYLTHSPHFGAMAGRVANRVGGGRFTLDGVAHHLDRNENGNCLHGGSRGFGNRLWTIDEQGEDFVRLGLVSADGDMGFPGRLAVTCTYRLEEPATMAIEVEAHTDAPTLCSLAHHSYFNLDDGGRTDATRHRLQVHAESYLPVDEALLPTGAVAPVEGTRFDFRSPKPIGTAGLDSNFCLAPLRRTPVRVATLTASRSGIALDVVTGEPGLQVYDAGGLKPGAPRGLDGIAYGAHAGICLEPQVWPDSPNHPGFPSAVLRPGERYFQRTEYRFRHEGA